MIGIVGLGLIGGSTTLAAHAAGHRVLAWDADPAAREAAAGSGLTVTQDLSDADLVVLAVPLISLMDRLPETLAAVRIGDAATITDVGSLKQPVSAAVAGAGLADRYVGGHPMAGSERAGFSAAHAELFAGARWALALNEDGAYGDAQLARWFEVAALVLELGAVVVPVTDHEHDEVMGLVSGLPHLLALALACAADGFGSLATTLAAGSFSDLTRVAASSTTLLEAVTVENRFAVRSALDRLRLQMDRPWADLVRDGHASSLRLRALSGRVEPTPRSPSTTTVVDGPETLLELGRSGFVVDAVDPVGGTVGHRRL